ncbi:unnamed protein product [Schistosoma mattheei]|uniref:Uncharacterized protein n=1 Tax=Schistosoma mattheei TaxID=31246 RepID=A0AA85BY87_9TREM|nr:unnamed protein product [Schistosoma mattheei]
MSKSSLPLDTFFKNFRFLKKTVVVNNNDYTGAFKSINKIINFDKVRSTVNFQQRYEKPTDWRRRYMYERCKRVYDSEMSRKISLVIRTHRVDPWPR